MGTHTPTKEPLKMLLASIEADLRDHSTPAPVFTFSEWLQIRRELRELIDSSKLP